MKNITFILSLFIIIFFSCNNTENKPAAESKTVSEQKFNNVDSVSIGRIDNIYNEYINLKNALVGTDPALASEAARMLSQTAKEFNFEPLQPEARVFLEEKVAAIEERAEAISGSTDVEQQREYFYPLSQVMYALLKSFDVRNQPVYYQFCPMAFDDEGAYWLSNEKQIRNPYFGDVMLKCGEVKEVIE